MQSDVSRAGVALPEDVITRTSGGRGSGGRGLGALTAAPLAVTKMSVEVNTVRAITYSPAAFERSFDEAAWMKFAGLHADEARMDAASVALVGRHNPYVDTDGGADPSAPLSSAQLGRVVRNFERRMALDTVRNEYLLRPALLRWLAEDPGRIDVEKLNGRVYAELFLTPNSDPWLGLLTPDTYTGLENDGVVMNK